MYYTLRSTVVYIHTMEKKYIQTGDLASFSCSSGLLGSSDINSSGSSAMTDVRQLNFHSPLMSWRRIAALDTSQI